MEMYPAPGDAAAEAIGKSVCAGCIVVDECLTWALKNGEHMGIWGGKTEAERRTINRKIKRNGNRDRTN